MLDATGMETWLPLVWAVLIAGAIYLYVCMDGFDLGLGILFPALRDKAERDVMVNTIAPVWDGNETWLVFGGAGLFAVFPLAYATILPALYMPLILMLLALVFRGVSFEMRFRTDDETTRLWWDRALWLGSLVATVCQGIALGAFVQGIRVEGRAYAGGWWDWLTPFSLLTAAALVVGYALLGACWLVAKTEGALQARARALAGPLFLGTLGFMGLVSAVMPFLQPAFRERWFSFPNVLVGVLAGVLTLAVSLWFFRNLAETRHPGTSAGDPERARARGLHDLKPFAAALALFLLGYLGLGFSMWPNVVPPSVSIWDAAAPPASMLFLLVGASVMIPVILGYTAYVYWLFRGKVTADTGYH